MRIEPAPEDLQAPEYDEARARFGWLPNTIRVMARGTNAAEQYLNAGKQNAEGAVPALAREVIAVHVAESNGCHYCRTAHLLAARALGAPANRGNHPVLRQLEDRYLRALVNTATRMLSTCGRLTDADLHEARTAGIDDRTLIDIAAVIAENTLGNLINNLAQTEIDPVLQRALERLST